MEPLITVVMPIYNGREFVARALRSVLDQDDKNFELLVIDDGSTDDSVDIIIDTLAASPRPGSVSARLIQHSENLGYGAATNTGLREARGDWITFVDCDDTIEPKYLERLLAPVLTRDAQLVMVRLCTVDESGHLGRLRQSFPETGVSSGAEALRQSALGDLVLSQHVLISRRVWEQVGPCSDNAYSDLIFLMQLLGKCRSVAYVDEPLYNYTIRSGSMTGSLRPSVWDLAMLHEPSKVVFDESFGPLDAAILHHHFELQILWQILQKAVREPSASYLRITIATWVRDRIGIRDIIWLARNGKPTLAGSFALAKLSPSLHRKVYGYYKRLKRGPQMKSTNDGATEQGGPGRDSSDAKMNSEHQT